MTEADALGAFSCEPCEVRLNRLLNPILETAVEVLGV